MRVNESLCNPLQDSFDILHHLIIPEAQYSIALVHEEYGPPLIRFRLRGVLPTIQFYNQTALWAAEVGDEATNRMLSPELCAV